MFDDQKLAVLGAFDGYSEVVEQKVSEQQQQIVDDAKAIKLLEDEVASAKYDVAALTAQLAQLNAVKVYRDLEFNQWSVNFDKAVGGSGLGHATNVSADKTADKYGVLSLIPDAPTPAQNGQNYFDCYFTKTFASDDNAKNYRLTSSWILPTAIDVANCRCLEMEVRHIIKGGLMFVVALQMNFAGKQLRYWGGPTGKWKDSGTPLARPAAGAVMQVILEGHRDDTNVYHDQITLNGIVTKLGTQYAASNDNWGPAIKCSLQLDGLNLAYNAKHRTKYEVW